MLNLKLYVLCALPFISVLCSLVWIAHYSVLSKLNLLTLRALSTRLLQYSLVLHSLCLFCFRKKFATKKSYKQMLCLHTKNKRFVHMINLYLLWCKSTTNMSRIYITCTYSVNVMLTLALPLLLGEVNSR